MTAPDAAHSRHGEPAALSHLRVLDLTGAGAQYCGRLMADLGADVVKVEPPEGDSTRRLRPYVGQEPGPERGIRFLSLNANKRSVALDLREETGRRRFVALARAADILVDDGSAFALDDLGLGYDALSRANPGLVYVTITPFGLSGPYSSYRSGELIVQAVGGLMYGFGDPNARPAMAPFSPGLQLAAQHAAFAALAAVRHRAATGRGQHIEVCVQEVLANILAYFGRYSSDGQINRRPGGSPTIAPTNTYPTSDGFIYMQPTFPRHVEALFEWLDNPVLEDDLWKDAAFRRQNGDVLNDLISEFSRGFTKMGFAEEAQRRHIPTAPLMTIHDLMQDDHLAHRKFLVDVEHPEVGRYPTPSGAFRMGASPWRLYRPPPLLGQHTDEVLSEWGVSSAEQPAAADGESGMQPPPASRPAAPAPQRRQSCHSELVEESPLDSSATLGMTRASLGMTRTALGMTGATLGGATLGMTDQPLPLKNTRVLDFSRVWAGPFMTRYLAELGAEVIKVESNMLPDRQQARGPFASFNFVEINRSKRSVTLNMRSSKAVELCERLIGLSDVVVENFRPGVLENWGIGYERQRELNPDIIYLSMPGMGIDGPRSSELAFGQSLLAYTGAMGIWAQPESPGITRPKVPLPDFYGAATGAFALLSALELRDRTGRGQMIELAQLEALVATMGEAFLDYFFNGHVPEARGNWDPNAAPHDVYPCLGFDAWCAIACYTDEHWRRLRGAMDEPEWAADPKFDTLDGRLANLAEMNDALSAWTADMTARQVMRLVQREGVPAGIVANGEDLYHDVNLRARDYVTTVDHRPVAGIHEHPGATVRLSDTPSRIIGPCPPLGAHNGHYFGELLGLTSDEIARLEGERVIF